MAGRLEEAAAEVAGAWTPAPGPFPATDRWERRLRKPVTGLAKGKLTVSVKDRQGNVSRIERTFSVGRAK